MRKNNDKVDYGQDMPGLVVVTSVSSIVCLASALWLYIQYSNNGELRNVLVPLGILIIGVFMASIAVVGVWSSRYGKLRLRDRVLSQVSIEGNERILDIGCGNGLLLLGAAKRLTTGKAVGADHWQPTMEYKYTSQMTLNNAVLEGVSEKVEVVTADVQSLPFDDCSFDIVMTSLMMHHVPDKDKAFKEMIRVLKPNGTLLVADVFAKRYLLYIDKLSVVNVKVNYITRLFFAPAFVVKCIKS